MLTMAWILLVSKAHKINFIFGDNVWIFYINQVNKLIWTLVRTSWDQIYFFFINNGLYNQLCMITYTCIYMEKHFLDKPMFWLIACSKRTPQDVFHCISTNYWLLNIHWQIHAFYLDKVHFNNYHYKCYHLATPCYSWEVLGDFWRQTLIPL